MKIVKIGVALLILMSLISFCKTPALSKVDFLIGTWKVEGKEAYESWRKEGNILIGESYKKRGDQKYISETLEIKEVESTYIYTATVKNQNEGKGIPFTLQEVKNDLYSFENLSHDFPKKIQYKILNSTSLQVYVLGEGDKGFSYKMNKQK